MVRKLLIILFFSVLLRTTSGEPFNPQILGVSVVSDTTIAIKPGQPVFALLKLHVSANRDAPRIKEVPSELSASLFVNGQERPLPAPSAVFSIVPSAALQTSDAMREITVLVSLYCEIEARDFLFRDVGKHIIRFEPEGQVDVMVLQPSREELQAIDRIKQVLPDSARLVLGTIGNIASQDIGPIEQLVIEFPDVVHTQLFSMAVGIRKLTLLDGPSLGASKYADEKLLISRRYLEPFTRGPLTTPLHAIAALQTAEVIEFKLRVDKGLTDAEQVTLKSQLKEELTKARDASFSLESKERAENGLRRIAN